MKSLFVVLTLCLFVNVSFSFPLFSEETTSTNDPDVGNERYNEPWEVFNNFDSVFDGEELYSDYMLVDEMLAVKGNCQKIDDSKEAFSLSIAPKDAKCVKIQMKDRVRIVCASPVCTFECILENVG